MSLADATTLADTTIRELVDFTDERGVLSFYAGHTPAQAADHQPTSPIEIRNQLRALRSRLAEGDPDVARAVERRLETLNGPLDQLMDPKSSGRGRALFVGVDSGEHISVALQIPFTERVIHRDGAYVRPLIAALDEGRPAGILVVSRTGTRLLRWAIGEATELEGRHFVVYDELLRGKSGPAMANPARAQQGYVDRDGFEERIDVNRKRFLREVVDDTVSRAKEEGWDRLVVSAPEKLREPVREMVAESDLRVLVAEQLWEDSPPHEIADAAWTLLRSVHRHRERELAHQAVDRALGGHAGAVGLRNVCDAINEGRVSHLLYDDELHLEGFVSTEGTLHPRVEGVIAESDVKLRREPWFVERLLETAIRTSAQVVPLGHDAAGLLADHEGVAALLRW
jgi:hypothetical protein